MKIRCVNISNESNTIGSSFKLNLNSISKQVTSQEIVDNSVEEEIQEAEPISLFKQGDSVEHKLEGIFGTITFICDDYTSIKWNDNSKEKFTKAEMDKYIIPCSKDLITESKEEETKIDIEKIKLQRKVDEMEKKTKDNLVDKVKTMAANELIDLAISKGMIDEDDKDIELQSVTMMDDEEYKKYSEEVLAFSNEHQVTSRVEDRDDLTEAERMLNRIKGTGGVIGDFSTGSSKPVSSEGGTRDLSSIGDRKITFDNQYVAPSFEDEFSDILSSSLGSISETKKVVAKKQETISDGVFGNLQGLTKPIQIPNDKVNVGVSKNDYAELFSSLNWSINK